MNDKLKAKLANLGWWTAKWAIATAIVVSGIVAGAVVYSRLHRQDLLIEATTNWFRQQSILMQQQQEKLQPEQPTEPPEN